MRSLTKKRILDLPRFFVEPNTESLTNNSSPTVGESYHLSESDTHHALHVLRLEPGERVVGILTPSGETFIGKIHGDSGRILVDSVLTEPPALAATNTLIFALSKGKRNDLIVEKATELGVNQIILWQATRSIVRIRSEKDQQSKLARWEKIAESAAKQCHRISLPSISLALTSEEIISLIPETRFGMCCSLSPEAAHLALVTKDDKTSLPGVIVIGPEGDLTPDEEAFFKSLHFRLVGLGGNILRSETAAIAAIAMYEALAYNDPST